MTTLGTLAIGGVGDFCRGCYKSHNKALFEINKTNSAPEESEGSSTTALIEQRNFFEICEIYDKHERKLGPAYNEYIRKYKIQELEKRPAQNQTETNALELTEASESDSIESFMLGSSYPWLSRAEFEKIIQKYEEYNDVGRAYGESLEFLKQIGTRECFESGSAGSSHAPIKERSLLLKDYLYTHSAFQEPSQTNRPICYQYALRGRCKKGDHCRYVHMRIYDIERYCEYFFTEGMCIAHNMGRCSYQFHVFESEIHYDSVCHTYALKGHCRNGGDCRYVHMRIDDIQNYCEIFFTRGVCLAGDNCRSQHHVCARDITDTRLSEQGDTKEISGFTDARLSGQGDTKATGLEAPNKKRRSLLEDYLYSRDSLQKKTNKSACYKYALYGRCRNGNHCRYVHMRIDDIQNYCKDFFIKGVCRAMGDCRSQYHLHASQVYASGTLKNWDHFQQ